MVASGPLDRTDDPTNRRALNLTLTPDGRTVVDMMTAHRRAAIAAILAQLLNEFNAAAGQPVKHDLWSMGWTTEAAS